MLLSISCSFYSKNGNSLLPSRALVSWRKFKQVSGRSKMHCLARDLHTVFYQNWFLAASDEQMNSEISNGRASTASLLLLIHSQWLSGVTQSFWVSADGISLQYSLQAPSAFGICLETSSLLLLPSNILWLFFFFYQNAHLGSQCCSFPPLWLFSHQTEEMTFSSQAKSWAGTAPQARHRTTSTDHLEPPHSPPSKNTSISTHRQTSTPLSKCH